ncbi:hypothetical protein FJZ36_17435 [Candidatus Poribacteria bacterium]|nr:hypothetical protein [Candidatus Poribacteria bacterium]
MNTGAASVKPTRFVGARRGSESARDQRGRVVGAWVRDPDGSLWLQKTGLDPARHMLRQPPAWSTDSSHLEELRRRGGVGVRLVLVDGTTFEARLDAFERQGIQVSRGFGPQIALPLDYWQTAGNVGQLVLRL